jgi:predicted CopG family antitoxin
VGRDRRRIVIEVTPEVYAQLTSLKARTGCRSWSELLTRFSDNSDLILSMKRMEDEVAELKRIITKMMIYITKLAEECRGIQG